MNKIEKAAIKLNDTIYSLPQPNRHHDIIRHMVEKYRIDPPISGKQGFITADNIFVDRIQAANIALKSGQIKKLIAPPNLFSEDLW